jgi:hypothetical protein
MRLKVLIGFLQNETRGWNLCKIRSNGDPSFLKQINRKGYFYENTSSLRGEIREAQSGCVFSVQAAFGHRRLRRNYGLLCGQCNGNGGCSARL